MAALSGHVHALLVLLVLLVLLLVAPTPSVLVRSFRADRRFGGGHADGEGACGW